MRADANRRPLPFPYQSEKGHFRLETAQAGRRGLGGLAPCGLGKVVEIRPLADTVWWVGLSFPSAQTCPDRASPPGSSTAAYLPDDVDPSARSGGLWCAVGELRAGLLGAPRPGRA